MKALDADLSSFESSPQVRNYLEHYGQILLTNYRSFALWSWRGGKAVPGERYSIAPSAKEFWDKTHTVRNDPKHPEHERLWQFLRRALLSTARIATPQDLALYLASYAREARARIEIAPMGTLEPVKKALSDALGVRFEERKASTSSSPPSSRPSSTASSPPGCSGMRNTAKPPTASSGGLLVL